MESAAFPDLTRILPCYCRDHSLLWRVGKITVRVAGKLGIRAAEIDLSRPKFGISLFIPCLSGKSRVRPELSGLRRAPYSPKQLGKRRFPEPTGDQRVPTPISRLHCPVRGDRRRGWAAAPGCRPKSPGLNAYRHGIGWVAVSRSLQMLISRWQSRASATGLSVDRGWLGAAEQASRCRHTMTPAAAKCSLGSIKRHADKLCPRNPEGAGRRAER